MGYRGKPRNFRLEINRKNIKNNEKNCHSAEKNLNIEIEMEKKCKISKPVR